MVKLIFFIGIYIVIGLVLSVTIFMDLIGGDEEIGTKVVLLWPLAILQVILSFILLCAYSAFCIVTNTLDNVIMNLRIVTDKVIKWIFEH